MTKNTIRISLILILILLNLQFLQYPNHTHLALKDTPTIQKSQKRQQLDSRSTKTQDDNTNKNLNLKKMKEFILDRVMTDNGGFPLEPDGDGYINATYFGVVTLYFLGGLNTNTSDAIKEWLDYSYDEELSGFREWLGANATFTATLWGIMIANTTGIKPTEFKLNSTLEFINESLNNIDINNLNLISSSLLLYVLSINRNSIKNSPLSEKCSELADHILGYFNNDTKFFLDSSVNLSPIFQTYLAIKALSHHDDSLIDNSIASNIIHSLLQKQHTNTSELYGGFGWDINNPSVFETGLSVDLILYLKKRATLESELINILDNEEFWSNITSFINRSQTKSGAIMTNPSSDTYDIFQAFGAINALIALEYINKLAKINVDIDPSDQIAVDYNKTIKISVTVEIYNEKLTGLNTYFELINRLQENASPITGELKHNNSKYELAINDLINMSFGNYDIDIYLWKNTSLNPPMFHMYTNFRIGYEIDGSVKPATARPGENITLSIDVKFHNNTYANQSDLYISISKNSMVIYNTTHRLNGSELKINYTIPSNISLGEYEIKICVNDSFGFNHTFKRMLLFVSDVILFNLSKHRTEYYVGEQIHITMHNITYNYTKHHADPSANLTATITYSDGTTLTEGNACWIVDEFNVSIKIDIHIPPKIPEDNNISLKIKIEWDKTTAGTKTFLLFNATLKLQKFYISNISFQSINNQTITPDSLFIGQKYRFRMQIIHSANITHNVIPREYTSCPIQNATVNISLWSNNETWFSGNMTYDLDDETYLSLIYIDPNIPEGNINVTIKILITYNDSWYNTTLEIPVKGRPSITNANFPQVAYAEKTYTANFSLICTETNKSLANVSLFANVTFINQTDNKTENSSILVPISTFNTTYWLSFDVQEADKMMIKIFRKTDNQTVLILVLDIAKIQEKKLFEIDPWSVFIPVIIVAYGLYLILRWRYSRVISRRFLIERAKKFK